MKYFFKKENVVNYLKMVEGYDGKDMVKILSKFLATKSTLLELGMGSGADLKLLAKEYNVIGSDNSQHFLDIFNENNKGYETMLLDAKNPITSKRFDCIYANKVLMHLSKNDFIKSLERLRMILNKDGIIFFTMWAAFDECVSEQEEDFISTVYSENEIKEIVSKHYEIIHFNKYKEFEEEDSFLLVIKPKR